MSVSTNALSVDPVEDYLLDSVSDTSSIMEANIDLYRYQPVSNSDISESATQTIDELCVLMHVFAHGIYQTDI